MNFVNKDLQYYIGFLGVLQNSVNPKSGLARSSDRLFASDPWFSDSVQNLDAKTVWDLRKKFSYQNGLG